jgi:hypothetical protein
MQCPQVAFFSRKSHLANSQEGKIHSGFALKGRFPGRMTGKTAFCVGHQNFLEKDRNLTAGMLSERTEAG